MRPAGSGDKHLFVQIKLPGALFALPLFPHQTKNKDKSENSTLIQQVTKDFPAVLEHHTCLCFTCCHAVQQVRQKQKDLDSFDLHYDCASDRQWCECARTRRTTTSQHLTKPQLLDTKLCSAKWRATIA